MDERLADLERRKWELMNEARTDGQNMAFAAFDEENYVVLIEQVRKVPEQNLLADPERLFSSKLCVISTGVR